MAADMPYRTSICVLVAMLHATAASGQIYSFGTDVYFYGDNTEFTNPFRAGDTTLGVSGRLFLDAQLNDSVTLRGGFFGLGRFGSHRFLEHAEPVIALHVTRGPSRFVFGSLETVFARHDVNGADEETPHRLLPPLQQETLAFTRGQEMGLQWLVAARRLDQDAWINWQRLNTSSHRERFDAGYRSSIAVTNSLRLQTQWHIVHEGGQQFQSGAVSDSQAGALGLLGTARLARMRFTADAHVVGTRHVPDRQQPSSSEAGVGGFSRVAFERRAWRAHVAVWRGRHTLKSEGDPNYHALRRDGTMFRQVRDYAEVGVTRHFRPAPGVHMFATFRLHRIESHYEYSYRIVGRVRLRHTF
jgi:hypothetical protein